MWKRVFFFNKLTRIDRKIMSRNRRSTYQNLFYGGLTFLTFFFFETLNWNQIQNLQGEYIVRVRFESSEESWIPEFGTKRTQLSFIQNRFWQIFVLEMKISKVKKSMILWHNGFSVILKHIFKLSELNFPKLVHIFISFQLLKKLIFLPCFSFFAIFWKWFFHNLNFKPQ